MGQAGATRGQNADGGRTGKQVQDKVAMGVWPGFMEGSDLRVKFFCWILASLFWVMVTTSAGISSAPGSGSPSSSSSSPIPTKSQKSKE